MALTRPRYSQIYDTDYKQSVRVATTGDVGNLLATGNMTNTIDGKSLAVADRILVKDQSDAKQNGIYRVATVGTGSNGTWIRALDSDASDKVTSGMTTTVAEGDTHGSKTFKLATPDPITLGVTELVFVNPFNAGTAAGADTYIQFNTLNSFDGTANLTFNKVTNTVNVGNAVILSQLIGSPNVTVSGSILPSANITYDLGSPTQRWREGWFSGSTIHIGNESMSVSEAGTWAFTSGGATVELGNAAVFNPPTANIAGNLSAGNLYSDNHNFSNGVSIVTTLSSAISTANTALKGYTDGQITTVTNSVTGANAAIVTANTAMKGYVDAVTTAWTANAATQLNQITGANAAITTVTNSVTGANAAITTVTNSVTGANAAIVTANTAMKGYVDAVTTAWTANAATQLSQISGANAAIVTANTALKGYVDAQITSLVGGAPAVLDTLNEIATALGNDANLSVTLTNTITTANTNMKGYVDAANTTQSSQITTVSNSVTGANAAITAVTNSVTGANAAIVTANTALKGYVDAAITAVTNSVTGANAAIVTANTAMKGYADAITTAWTANAATQLNQITGANAAITTVTNSVTGANAAITAVTNSVTGANAAIVTANTAMKGYADAITTAWTANAATQLNQITGANAAITTVTNSVTGANAAITTVTNSVTGANAAITTVTNSVTGANAAMVTSVTGTAPVTSSGGKTPAISMAAATALVNGYMTSTYASKLDGIAAGATNVTNTNQLTNGAAFVTASVTLTTAAQTNITSVGTLTALTVSGALSSGAHTITGSGVTAIINGGTTGVGNIGASGATFNTAFLKSTSAQYADLAEVYRSDRNYVPGTVLVFGGSSEVTVSLTSHDPTVAGVVSTNPAYLMNDREDGSAVALQGRVPCRVLGPVSRGDRVVTSDVRGVAERLDMSKYQPGCIIGKTLGSVPEGEIATIEVVVGRV